MRSLAWGLVLMTAAACVPPGAPPPSGPNRLDQALDALARNEVRTATLHLRFVADSGRTERLRRTATLLLAVLSLDPRNPARDPDRAAQLAARYVAGANNEAETELGRALYLVALDLGADARKVAGAPAVPDLRRPPVADRLRDLEREIASLRDELERIRKTLKQ
jgi:hypothetical protein